LIALSAVKSDNIADLVTLLRAIASDESPEAPLAADKAEADLAASRAAFDWTRSDSSWILLAYVDGEPAGYAVICRIPKADERAGFLFVDELHVLRAYRRRGVARALLARVDELARELGLHGVRLLVRPGNEPARSLYRKTGFEEYETVFCQKVLTEI
jgi:ribosomal protein S18 acetylase RimI-like enzyme